MKILDHDCKYYSDGRVWVCYDGKFAACKNHKSGEYEEMPIIKDDTGKKIINTQWNVMVDLAEAVATCNCQKPADGKRYMAEFNDGDQENCYYKNLSWAPYQYFCTTAPSVELNYFGTICTAMSSGDIVIEGNVVKTLYYWKDKSSGLNYVGNPFLYVKACDGVHFYRLEVDEIMKDARYVQGTDVNLADPVILHRDGNWLNFATSNLEWCESSDIRYQQYMSRKLKDRKRQCAAVNKDKSIPNDFIQ